MHFSTFLLVSAVVLGVPTLIAGVVLYRRGDRWMLAALLAPPAGAMLGIYADHHHQRALGIPAFLLIMALPVLKIAERRREAAH